MYDLIPTASFQHSLKSILKDNKTLKIRINKTLQLLSSNPNYPSLKSHKVNTKNYGQRWSSWVTGDMRIIWDYDNANRLVILLLDIGSHSGKHKVYK